MDNLKVVVDGDPNTSKLPMDNAPSTMTFVLIIYSLLEKLVPWKGLNWDIGDEL
jgi:hypothetical protein